MEYEGKLLANHIMSDQKSLFVVTNELFYFLQAIFCPEHIIPQKTITDRSFLQGWYFLTKQCDVTTVGWIGFV